MRAPNVDEGDPLSALPFTVPTQYRQTVLDAAAKYNIRPALLAAQIEAESGFRNLGPNSAGARGIAQFMPGTALGIGVNPMDTTQSIFGAARLDSEYIASFGSEALALAAYNAGPGAVKSHGNQVPDYPETKAYVSKILGWAGGTSADTGSGGTAVADTTVATPNATLSDALGKVRSGTAWQRLGKGTLGILLAMFGIWFAFGNSSIGRTVKGQAKKAAAAAAVA